MKTAAAIPCFNEGKYIGDVVREASKYVDAVIVADDHSLDMTRDIAKQAGAHVVLNPYRNGAGANTAAGLAAAYLLGADVIVTLDGDGQHDPRDIPVLLAPVITRNADISIGVRPTETIPSYRLFGNRVINIAHNVWSKPVTDTQSGFRCFTRAMIEMLRFEEHGFGFSTEVLSKARKNGARIVEVPISCVYHEELGSNSTVNPIKHGVGVLIKTIRWRLWELS